MKERIWQKRYRALRKQFNDLLMQADALAEENEELIKQLAALQPQPEFSGEDLPLVASEVTNERS